MTNVWFKGTLKAKKESVSGRPAEGLIRGWALRKDTK